MACCRGRIMSWSSENGNERKRKIATLGWMSVPGSRASSAAGLSIADDGPRASILLMQQLAFSQGLAREELSKRRVNARKMLLANDSLQSRLLTLRQAAICALCAKSEAGLRGSHAAATSGVGRSAACLHRDDLIANRRVSGRLSSARFCGEEQSAWRGRDPVREAENYGSDSVDTAVANTVAIDPKRDKKRVRSTRLTRHPFRQKNSKIRCLSLAFSAGAQPGVQHLFDATAVDIVERLLPVVMLAITSGLARETRSSLRSPPA